MVLHVARALDSSGGSEPPLNSWKRGPLRLGHDLGQHVQPAAMGHAEHDLLEAELAAALDDLLQRRDRDSPPSRPKRLVPLYLTSMNCSKPSASISF